VQRDRSAALHGEYEKFTEQIKATGQFVISSRLYPTPRRQPESAFAMANASSLTVHLEPSRTDWWLLGGGSKRSRRTSSSARSGSIEVRPVLERSA
jgi:hypothetical protein